MSPKFTQKIFSSVSILIKSVEGGRQKKSEATHTQKGHHQTYHGSCKLPLSVGRKKVIFFIFSKTFPIHDSASLLSGLRLQFCGFRLPIRLRYRLRYRLAPGSRRGSRLPVPLSTKNKLIYSPAEANDQRSLRIFLIFYAFHLESIRRRAQRLRRQSILYQSIVFDLPTHSNTFY